jgi:hypothetical protein
VASRGERLVALLPVAASGVRLGLRRRPGAWTSPYAVGTTPLLDRDLVEPAGGALLDGLAALARGGAFAWPLLSLETPVGRTLRDIIARRGWPHAVEDAFARAVLDRRESYDAYAAELGRNRRKGMRRLRARLEEAGALEHVAVMDGEALPSAVEAFLALEASGWKGRAGTALAARADTAAFARRLFGGADGPVRARADLLTLDGRPIAASLALVCGGTAHLLKTAYDESLRRLAPGLVLEDAIVRGLHETGFARRLDSAGTEGCVLESLYPDRETVATLVFATGPMGEGAFRRLIAVDRARRAAWQGLRRLRRR